MSEEAREKAAENQKAGFSAFNFEPAGNLFADDTMTPDQFNDMRRSRMITGEKRLLARVFKDGVREIIRGPGASKASRRIFTEALAWAKDLENDGPFSFSNTCEAANPGYEPSAVLRGILRIMKNQEARKRLLRDQKEKE